MSDYTEQAREMLFGEPRVALREIAALLEQQAQMREALEKAQADARRYQYLRAGNMEFAVRHIGNRRLWLIDFTPEEADAAIDATLAQHVEGAR